MASETTLIAWSWPMTRIVQALLHVQQLLRLALHHARDGDAGHGADKLGDVLLRDDVADGVLLLPLRLAAPRSRS